MKVKCSGCGAKLNAPQKLYGKSVNCPKCKTTLAIPKGATKEPLSSKPSPAASQDTTKQRVACPGCNAKLTATQKLFGHTVNCPKCKTAISIPQPGMRDNSSQEAVVEQQTNAPKKPIQVPSNPEPSAPSVQPPLETPVTQVASSVWKEPSTQLAGKSRMPWILTGIATLIGIGGVGAVLFFLFGGGNRVADSDTKTVDRNAQEKIKPLNPGESLSPKVDEDEGGVPSDAKAELPERSLPVGTLLAPKPKRPTGVPPSSYAPINVVLRNNWQPVHEAGYTFKIQGKENGNVEAYAGTLLMQPTALASVVQRSDRHNKFHPEIEYGSGLAIPENQIVTGLQLVEGDAEIQIVVDGKSYPAAVISKHPKQGFAVLQVDGFQFAPVPWDRFTKVKGLSTLAWRTPNGDLALETIDVRSNDTSAISKHSVGGVIVKGWRGIGAMILRHKDVSAGSVYGIYTSLEQIVSSKLANKDLAFEDDFDTSHANEDQIRSTLGKHVVQVIVRRKVSSSDRPKVAFHSTLYSASHPQKPFRRVQAGAKRDFYSELKFHPQFEEQFETVLRLDENGNLREHADDRDRDDVKSLPYFLGTPFGVPRITFPDGQQQEWTVENRVALKLNVQEAKGQVEFMYADFEFVYSDEQWEKTSPANRARRLETYQVLGKSDTEVAWIKRKVILKSEANGSVQETRGVPPGVPIELSGEELIEFDIAAGVVLGTTFSGRLKTELSEIDISFKYEIMDSQRRLAAKPPWRSEQVGRFPLAAVDLDSLLAGLVATNNTDKEAAVNLLKKVAPEFNEKVAGAIAANFSKLVGVRGGKVCARWIEPSQFPVLPQPRNSSFANRYLFESPPFVEAHEYLATHFADDSDVSNVLMTRYPGMIEELALKRIVGLKKFTPGDYVLLNLLSIGGTEAAIPALEDLKRVIRNDRLNKARDNQEVEMVDAAIARIRRQERR